MVDDGVRLPSMPQSAADFMQFARATIVALRRIQAILGIDAGLQASVEELLEQEHNDLTGLQGGTTDQYYHLTSTQHGNVAALGAWSYAASASAARTALGFSSKYWVDSVTIHANGAASLGMGTHASGAAFLAGSNRNITHYDATHASHVRLIGRVTTASASANTPRLRVRGYKGSFSTTIGNYTDVAGSEVAISLEATGLIDSGWVALSVAYQTEFSLIVDQIGGDSAASPAVAGIYVLFKGTNTEP